VPSSILFNGMTEKTMLAIAIRTAERIGIFRHDCLLDNCQDRTVTIFRKSKFLFTSVI
jgi:hypothetical protein